MSTFATNLVRMRVAAATGAAPPDLLRWAVDALDELAPAAESLEARNVLLRQAAALVSGSRWAKARRLEREIAALALQPRLRERAADDGVRDRVALALEFAPAPRDFRHLRRVLG